MKRAVTLFALAAVAVVPNAGHTAEKRVERTEVLNYTLPTGVTTPAALTGSCGDPVRACLNVTLGKNEKYIKFTAADATGQPVGVQYFAGETNADYAGVQSVCNEGKATFKKGGLVSFRIAVDPTCGVPTQGTLTVVISNLP